MKTITKAIVAFAATLLATPASAVFLNYQNTTIQLVSPGSLTGGVITNAIDLDAVSDTDDHTQGTHVWLNGTLEFKLTFNQNYDLELFHFWNYFEESFDADQIDLTYMNSTDAVIGNDTIFPALGPDPSAAETFDITDVIGVKSVTAILTGTNGSVDFQNIGFTGSITAIPLPAALPMFVGALGLLGWIGRKR